MMQVRKAKVPCGTPDREYGLGVSRVFEVGATAPFLDYKCEFTATIKIHKVSHKSGDLFRSHLV